MKQNKKVAVTGGIGSGKSTVCEIIRKEGYPVFSCDKIYSDLLQNKSFTKMLADGFGEEVLDTDGLLNREALSQIVFNDGAKLEKLNKITHAKIFEEMFSRAENLKGVVFFEVPLLFEGSYQHMFDEVVVILRSESDRISSVVKRDDISYKNVKKRIEKQYNYENNTFEQYYVIHNDGNFDKLSSKVRQIITQLK